MKSVFDPMDNFLEWDELDTESDDWIEEQEIKQQQQRGKKPKTWAEMGTLERAAVVATIWKYGMIVFGIIFMIWLMFSM